MTDDELYDGMSDEPDYIDIEATVEALKEAWQCMPDASLSELLDSVTPMPFCELSNAELIQELNEFILQNRKQ